MKDMENKWFELRYDPRLKLERPYLFVEYDQLPAPVQEEFEFACQRVCAQIPDKIKEFERKYLQIYESLKEAKDEEFFAFMDELNEISSIICDLNLLYLHIEGTYLSGSVHM
jgi:hypothetical protein